MESRDLATNQIQIQKDRKEVVYHEVGEMIIIIPLLQSPKQSVKLGIGSLSNGNGSISNI